MGSNVSHFNISLIVRDKVTRRCPQTTTFEEKGEPKRIRTEVPLLTSLTPYRSAKPANNSSQQASNFPFIGRAVAESPDERPPQWKTTFTLF